MVCFHTLLTTYGAGITTGGVQWVVYIEIKNGQRMASKSAKNMEILALFGSEIIRRKVARTVRTTTKTTHLATTQYHTPRVAIQDAHRQALHAAQYEK